MKILFAYTGEISIIAKHGGQTLFDDLMLLPTTHMSEVNYLLLGHWLRSLGHDVSVLVSSIPQGGEYHFRPVSSADVSSAEFDVLLLFKVHALKFSQQAGYLELPWKRVVTWLDSPAPDNIIGNLAWRIDVFAWGTPALVKIGEFAFPRARHILCEHATVFSDPPTLGCAKPRGLFAGRLPVVYRDQVFAASEICPMLVYALWLSTDGEDRILLRPGQFLDEDLVRARKRMPKGVDLQSGVNVIANAETVSQAAFGFCPGTLGGDQEQILSASKFYDYLALGLPVVLSSNTPESAFVRETPILGELYSQGDSDSLQNAIGRALARFRSSTFAEERAAIQSWVFSRATYRHRAQVLHDWVI